MSIPHSSLKSVLMSMILGSPQSLDWNGGMDWWNGLVDWNGGIADSAKTGSNGHNIDSEKYYKTG